MQSSKPDIWLYFLWKPGTSEQSAEFDTRPGFQPTPERSDSAEGFAEFDTWPEFQQKHETNDSAKQSAEIDIWPEF